MGTTTCDGKNIPKAWFDHFVQFLDKVIKPAGGRGCVGQEAGNKKGHIHLQITIEARTTADEAGRLYLKNFIEEYVIQRCVGRRLILKQFSAMQDVLTMTGPSLCDLSSQQKPQRTSRGDVL